MFWKKKEKFGICERCRIYGKCKKIEIIKLIDEPFCFSFADPRRDIGGFWCYSCIKGYHLMEEEKNKKQKQNWEKTIKNKTIKIDEKRKAWIKERDKLLKDN